MNYRLIAPVVVALSVSGCQATKSAPSYSDHVEASASACADEIAAKNDAKKSVGYITWNMKVTPGQLESVHLPYVELGADGANKGAAWRACLKSRGVLTDTLDLGERDVKPLRLANIG